MTARRVVAPALAALPLVLGCGDGRGAFAASADHLTRTPTDDSVTIDTVATGLEVPWALAFAPDGRAFLTERPGRIRVIDGDHLRPAPWATVDVHAEGEAGLTGIAVAPDFARSRAVYVLGTFAIGAELVNRVVRFVERDGHGIDARSIVDSIPAAPFHAGGAIAFGPDGMLYVATGDARSPAAAENPRSLRGKILRYTADGAIPADNPTPGSPVWALGVHNVQGLAWNAGGQLFTSEHGPSGFPNEGLRHDHDELSVIRPGGNYGWQARSGSEAGDAYTMPIVAWTPGIAPSGIAVYSGREFPSWRGQLFVGALRGEQLRRLAVARDARAASGWRVVAETPMFAGRLGRVRAVATDARGRLYFTTSNRDGRGSPSRYDDKVLRLARKR